MDQRLSNPYLLMADDSEPNSVTDSWIVSNNQLCTSMKICTDAPSTHTPGEPADGGAEPIGNIFVDKVDEDTIPDETANLWSILTTVPPQDFARYFSKADIEKLKATSKTGLEVVKELGPYVPVGFEVDETWIETSKKSRTEKANLILHRMLVAAKRWSVRVIKVPGCLQLSSLSNSVDTKLVQVYKLVEILSLCSDLTHLDLSKSHINGFNDIAIIADQLQKCRSLTHLNLSMNRHLTSKDERSRQSNFFEKLVVNLRDCLLLRDLILHNVEMEDKELILLARNLPQYQGLKNLDIASNEFSDVGITELARFLPDCPKLSRLYIQKNQVHLSAMDLVNSCLQISLKNTNPFFDPLVLNLNDCWISPDNVKRIQDISDAHVNIIVLTRGQAIDTQFVDGLAAVLA
jgi:hypothetical protein